MDPILSMLVSWSAVLVCAVFALIVAFTYRPGKRRYYERQGAIPLDDAVPNARER